MFQGVDFKEGVTFEGGGPHQLWQEAKVRDQAIRSRLKSNPKNPLLNTGMLSTREAIVSSWSTAKSWARVFMHFSLRSRCGRDVPVSNTSSLYRCFQIISF